MTKLRGIIFDKDGTLFDFSRTWEAWAQSFLRRIALDEDHAKALGRAIGFDTRRNRFEPDSIAIAGTPWEIAGPLANLLPRVTQVELVEVINEEAVAAPQVEVVSLSAFLPTLRADGFRLGVVTNDSEVPARAHLQAAGALPFFDFIAGSDSGYGAKPDPGQLIACADVMAFAPQEILMVGDSTHDLQAAARAGMPALGVLSGPASETTLAPLAQAVLPDIGHLPDWLAKYQSG